MTSIVEETGYNGEDKENHIDETSQFYQWMIQQKAKPSVIKKLIKYGYDSIDMIQSIEMEDMSETINEANLKGSEKINFKMIIKNLSKQHSFVDIEETKTIVQMQKNLKSVSDSIQLITETETENSSKPRTIHWVDVDDKIAKIHPVQIESSKHQNVQINNTNLQKKNMLSETKVETNYFDGWANTYSNSWKEGIRGKVATIIYSPFVLVNTITGLSPAMHAFNEYQGKKKLTFKKERNSLSKIFNDKVSQITKSKELICTKVNELRKQEQKLNSHEFELERFYDLSLYRSRVAWMIGPTGCGKSLMSNRLLGNNDDIYDISESKSSDFEVAKIGNIESVTDKLTKKSKVIYITDKNKQDDFILSVVDTPGAFDCKCNDDDYNNMMSHYFSACGGVNIFAIFFKFGSKITSNYQELIKQYVTFFGEGFWQHSCIFITHCEWNSDKGRDIVLDALKTTKKQIHLFLKDVSNGIYNKIPIFVFGQENFKQSRSDFLSLLMDQSKTFHNKYKCKNIKSPIDLLHEELLIKIKQHNQLLQDLQTISKQIDKTESQIQNTEEFTNKVRAISGLID